MNWRVCVLDLLRKMNQNKWYNYVIADQFSGDEHTISDEMREGLLAIFKHHLNNNENYRKFLIDKGVSLNKEWSSIEDIPIITKEDLKKYYPILENYTYRMINTSGSTNEPFKYPVSVEAAEALWPNLWTAFDVCGVKPCEKMLMLSWHNRREKGIKKDIYHKLSNFYTMSAFQLSESELLEMYKVIVNKEIKVIYGYSSSVLEFLYFLKKKELYLDLKGIFTTSENTSPALNQLSLKYCNCHTIDIFGANDGGLLAFECKEHSGYHIMHQRTVVEIVDNKIIVTDRLNKAFPFIRYCLGDLAKGDKLITERCKCGRTTFRVDKFIGRESYMFTDNSGNKISIFQFAIGQLDEDQSILRYQILKQKNSITINIISDTKDLEYYKNTHLPYLKSKMDYPLDIVLNQKLVSLSNEKVPLFYEFKDEINGKN